MIENPAQLARSRRQWRLGCLGLVVAAFAIRVWAFQAQGLNANEEWAFNFMRGEHWVRTFEELRSRDAHPPLFYYLMRGAYVAGLRSYPAWRTLSAAAGALTLLLFLGVAGAGCGRRVALLAGAMMAISLPLVQYEGEARMYPWANLALMACVAGHYAFFQTGRWRALAGAMLAQAAAAYTSYMAYFGIGAAGLAGLICLGGMKNRSLALRWIGAQALFVVVPLSQAMHLTPTSHGMLDLAAGRSIEAVLASQGSQGPLGWMQWLWWMGARTWPLTFALVGFAGAGLAGASYARRPAPGAREEGGPRFLRLFTPILLAICLAALFFAPSLFRAYTFLFAAPWLYCLAAAGMSSPRKAMTRAVVAATVLPLFLPSLFLYATHESNEPWKTAVAFLKEKGPDYPFPIFAYHYPVIQVLKANGYDGPGELIGLPGSPETDMGPIRREQLEADLERFRAEDPDAPAFFVYFRPPVMDDVKLVKHVLRGHYAHAEETVFASRFQPGGADVIVDYCFP